MDAIAPLDISIFFFLLFLSGFFSAVETAMHSLGKVAIKQIVARGGRRAHLINVWSSDPHKFLNTIYFGNSVLKVGATVLGASITVDVARQYGYYEPYALMAATALIVLVLLLLAEVAPKTVARNYPETTFLTLATPIQWALTLLKPFSWFFTLVSSAVVWMAGGAKTARKNLDVTEDEIRAIVEAGEIDGAIEEDEKDMIHSIIEFGDTIVKEIMIPRVDIICVSIDTPMDEILQVMADEKLSRLPVYEQTVDTIVGIIHIKNIMNFWRKSVQDMSAVEFISMPYFVPETKKVSELLREFQANHLQMAIVVDEYGGTAGLVTMEDLIEEIVGEITDEYDEGAMLLRRQEDGTYLLDAKLEIHTLNEHLHLDLPSEEYHTIGGLILWLARRMPRKNDAVTYKNLRFVITEADRKRIHKVVLEITKAEPPGHDSGPKE